MSEHHAMPGVNRKTQTAPGHWVLAQLGKKVLRPGGKALTQKMLAGLKITQTDDVVEFAPGLGFTAQLCLAEQPKSYTAIEQNEQAAAIVRAWLTEPTQTCQVGNAQATGLDDAQASVVYGEAMLTMQSAPQKSAIVSEAARILRPEGRYAIHELCITPDTIAPDNKRTIQKEVTEAIQHSAKPLTPSEWNALLEHAGFEVEYQAVAPMHLLEPRRILDDEGIKGLLTIVKNVLTRPAARKRVMKMRKIFRKHGNHLSAITLVARKRK